MPGVASPLTLACLLGMWISGNRSGGAGFRWSPGPPPHHVAGTDHLSFPFPCRCSYYNNLPPVLSPLPGASYRGRIIVCWGTPRLTLFTATTIGPGCGCAGGSWRPVESAADSPRVDRSNFRIRRGLTGVFSRGLTGQKSSRWNNQIWIQGTRLTEIRTIR